MTNEKAEWQPTVFDHVKIQLDDHGKGNIWINGQKLKTTFGFRIAAAAGYTTRVTIEFAALVEYEGPAEVEAKKLNETPDAGRYVDDFMKFADEK